ncbi:MAG: hypothetical protein Q9168_003212 [Polycauliona sp. 1 TL-2023]
MQEQAVQCPHEGNPDFYGLGIRIGIYLQLTTAIVAKYFHPEAIPENLTANTTFLLALFAAVATATRGFGIRPEEVVILLQLSFGSLLSVLLILGGRRRTECSKPHDAVSEPPPIASYLRLMLSVAICAYAVWFWFSGKDEIKIPGCDTYMFLLTKVSIFGGVGIFYQVQSAIILIPLGILFIWYSVILLWYHSTTLVRALVFALTIAHRNTQPEIRLSTNTAVGTSAKTALKLAFAVWWTGFHGVNFDKSTRRDKEPWILTLHARIENTVTETMARYAIPWTLTIVTLSKLLFTLTCFFWTILSVELTLVFNRISGVYDIRSTGQLIPFIISLVRLLSLCHGIAVRHADTGARRILLVCFARKSSPANTNMLELGT